MNEFVIIALVVLSLLVAFLLRANHVLERRVARLEWPKTGGHIPGGE